MGSFCRSGPSTSTSTTESKSKYNPFARDEMQDIYGRIWEAGQNPYTPYGGQMVADINATQQGGIGKITDATRYLDAAAGYAHRGAAPISDWDIERYYNPFTQGVIDATQRQFEENNRAQQSQVTGNAALKGALGGDRVGVAQAETARLQKLAQDPVIAKLHQDKYNMAMAAAQGDRSAAQQGASGFNALHSGALAGGQSQIGAGGLQYGVDQSNLNALYQQFQQQQQFPYQQAQWLAQTGLPVLSAQGGTQTGSGTSTQTQQAAQPSYLQQAVGLGTMAVGAFSGNPMAMMGGAGMMGGGSGGAGMGPIGTYSGSGNPWASGGMNWYARGGSVRGRRNGGFIDRVSELRMAMRRGGGIHVPRGYADGGEVGYPMNLTDPRNRILGIEYGDVEGNPAMFSPPMAFDQPEAPAAPPLALPPQIAQPGGGGPIMAPAMQPAMRPAIASAAPPQMSPAEEMPTDFSAQSRPAFPPPATGGGLSEEARMGLIAAGLGILASKHPNALGAIGEGGLAGIKQYTTGKQTKEKNELAARKLLMDAQQFAQGIDLRKKTLEETKRYHDMSIDERREGRQERSEDRRDAAARTAYPGEGVNEKGETVKGLYQFDPDTREYVFKPGKVIQKGASGAGRQGQTQQIIEELRKENPTLSYQEALALTKRAPQGDQAALRRESLALSAAKADLEYLRDPQGTLEKWRKQYGLSGGSAPSPAAKPGAAAPSKPAASAPPRPSSVPAGSQYSPSRKMWRDPSGKLYNEQGQPAQ